MSIIDHDGASIISQPVCELPRKDLAQSQTSGIRVLCAKITKNTSLLIHRHLIGTTPISFRPITAIISDFMPQTQSALLSFFCQVSYHAPLHCSYHPSSLSSSSRVVSMSNPA